MTSGFDKQIDREGKTVADLLVEYLGDIADVLVEIRDMLKEIEKGLPD